MDDSMLSLGVVLALVFVGIIVLIVFFQFIPFGLWLTALFSGIRISFFTLFGMRFRRVDLVGQEGVALTDLRPAGTARIGAERVDVVTEGEYVSQGAPIRVVRSEGYRHVVMPVAQ